MAEKIELAVSRREAMGKAAKRLRKAGIIPANIFGHHEPSLAIQLDASAFDRLRRTHGARGIISLHVAGEIQPHTVLIRHVERDAISDKILHIDFFRVSMSERITVKAPLHLTGEAPAVKLENGVLLHLLDALEIECRASDIPDSLSMDVSSMTAIDDIIYAKDVPLPKNLTLITDPDEPVAKVAATRAEVAEVAAEAAETPAPAASTESGTTAS
jgi:large subunit ribosomal protein L25